VTVLVVGGPIARADVPGLCARVSELLAHADGEPCAWLVCDVRAVGAGDAVTVDALARMQLAAKRRGRQIRVRHASPDLERLLSFCALSDVLRLEAAGSEPVRQAEHREQAGRVEERVEPDDPPV
jgi:ABC-type transporter Mla MlaB component